MQCRLEATGLVMSGQTPSQSQFILLLVVTISSYNPKYGVTLDLLAYLIRSGLSLTGVMCVNRVSEIVRTCTNLVG